MKLNEIFTFENLYESHKNCRKSKQHKGEVIRFEINLSYNISSIIKSITSKKYKLGSYKTILLYEPKERIIEAPIYKDRVIIRCLCDYCIKPKIDKKLIYDNAACRTGKGSTFAIERLEYFLRREFKTKKDNKIYFLKCDIKKYFPSINHEVLINLLKEVGVSEDEMWIMEKFIRVKENEDTGLPLGNQTSQWFALFYLNKVDRLIKEKLRVKNYIRYMDDMILVHRDKNYLRYCLKEIEKMCKEELKLELNKKTQIGKVKNGIDFLGYRHILNENGKIIRKLRQSTKIRLKRHIKTLDKLKNKNIIDEEYVFLRKNAYYNRLKNTKESKKLKEQVFPNITKNV